MVALPRIIVKRWKDAGIDVLVNNAGMGRNDASLFDGNTASWVEMVSTNTLGVCMCTREAVQVRNLICALAWSILSHPRVLLRGITTSSSRNIVCFQKSDTSSPQDFM